MATKTKLKKQLKAGTIKPEKNNNYVKHWSQGLKTKKS